ncbi:MAG: molecular chaperone DnaK, partial [Gammaproteobacteria bacterium]|nr:molecular chaperone DnaK [Gammaproteobacteria bacterium]
KAVVTVPAYFDDNQRNATKDACRIAGIEVARLVNEPTAAALAYGLDRVSEELRIAVIDFGGGTLDVTIMEFGGGVFEVKSTSGDTQLGGTDMDQKLLNYLADRFRNETGVDIHNDTKAIARLKEAAEIAKIELSNTTTTHISLPYLTASGGDPKHLEMDLTRTEMERQIRDVIERCRSPIEQAIEDASITTSDLNRIIFVGGPTRMPAVRQFFEELLGRKAEMGIDPMECVASGAAIQAAVLSGEVSDIVLVDVTPLTLGVETLGGVATSLIARNTPIPIKHTETFTTAADMQTAVTINVFQGERPMSSDNISLGEFNLEGLVPAPRGVHKVDVTFDIDANGIINVTAKDQATGRSQSITISGSSRLTEGEKERMVEDAEKYADADKKRREDAEKLNEADSICYQAEKMLADFSDKLTADMRNKLQQAMHETREAIEQKNTTLASEKSATLANILKEAGVVIYSQQPDAGVYRERKVDSDVSGAGPRDNVVDADYEENR